VVNFGAAKLKVIGEVSIAELEKAGAFENLKIIPENQRFEVEKVPFYIKHWNVILAVLFLIAGWFIGRQLGEDNVISTVAYAGSILIGGYNLLKIGLLNLIRLQFDMKTLMTVAIIGAGAIGEWGEGAAVVILFAISEALETYSMEKARQSIRSLMDIAPKEAFIRRGFEEIVIPVEEIEVGDVMIVKPGQKLAMDGVVVKGTSSINQAAITGESVPVAKAIKDEVYAGTLNGEGLLEVKVTKTVADTTIAKIIHLVEEAQAERAPSQAFVDRFAKYYTPTIMVFALGVAIFPPIVMNGEWAEWIYRGLAVLVVGCPCALVISTPVAIVTAIGNAARHGVLIKGGVHLEQSATLSTIAFDKTGTLTRGVPEVTEFINLSEIDEHEILAIAAALEKGSEHPLASSIVRKAATEQIEFTSIEVDEFISITGKGVRGAINQQLFSIGSPGWFNDLMTTDVLNRIYSLQKQGKTVMVLESERKILALFAVADEVRKQSKDVIEKLHKIGIQKTIMLTGDNQNTAQAIGEKLGVTEIHAELLPEEKLAFIKKLRSEGGRVGMVGDGVNDAPALAASTVGIAMGGAGTDTALETADIALMADDLSKLPFMIRLSRRTLRIIKENISFSIGIKIVALLLIIPGWLTLWMAIFADMGATLIVTLNSLRLLRTKE
jgi:Zn2+/Cd2+-exporting ATPase